MNAIGRIVCWHCRRGNKQLFRLKNESGKKLPDYVCVECKPKAPARPPIGNVSMIRFPSKEELKKQAEEQAKKLEQHVVTPGPKVVAAEGDPVSLPK